MIPIETRYETHNGKLLAIIEVFQTWYYYLKGYKHDIFVHTYHNNLNRFIDMKSLNFKQVHWALELYNYHFWLDYYQGKANVAIDTLTQYSQ